QGTEWFPVDGFSLPKGVAGVNTAILLSSSLTMHWALVSIRRGDRGGLRAGLLLTTLLGATFLTVQITEYVNLTAEGMTPQLFAQGSVFYGLTGLHGAHVLIGLIAMTMTTVRAFRGH